MGSTRFLHKISQDELCTLLDVDERGLRKLERRGLPTPIDRDDEGTWWSIVAIRDWLATTNYRSLRELLLEWWPDATAPADLLRAQLVRRDSGTGEPVAVLQHWQTDAGTAVVAWPLGGWSITGFDTQISSLLGDLAIRLSIMSACRIATSRH